MKPWYKSKKFVLIVAAGVLLVADHFLGLLDNESKAVLGAGIVSYLLGQSYVDANRAI